MVQVDEGVSLLGPGQCGAPDLGDEWEYRVEDPDVAYAVYGNEKGDVPRSASSFIAALEAGGAVVKGRLLGVRMGKGNPDYFSAHLGPDKERYKYQEPKVNLLNIPCPCEGCGNPFLRPSLKTRYCSEECRCRGSSRRLPLAVNCKVCGTPFRPTSRWRVCCGRTCGATLSKGEHVLSVDLEKFKKLWLAGGMATDIARELGVSVGHLRKLKDRAGVPDRSVGRQPPSFKLELLAKMWDAGYRAEDICRALGVCLMTLNKWKSKLGLEPRLVGNHKRTVRVAGVEDGAEANCA